MPTLSPPPDASIPANAWLAHLDAVEKRLTERIRGAEKRLDDLRETILQDASSARKENRVLMLAMLAIIAGLAGLDVVFGTRGEVSVSQASEEAPGADVEAAEAAPPFEAAIASPSAPAIAVEPTTAAP